MLKLDLLLQAIRANEIIVPKLYESFGAMKVNLAKAGDTLGLKEAISKDDKTKILSEISRVKIEAMTAALKSNSFIFAKWNKLIETEDEDSAEIVSMPFESVWIEVFSGTLDGTNTHGALVYEIAPGVVRAILLNVNSENKSQAVYMEFNPDSTGEMKTAKNIESNLWQLSKKGVGGRIAVKEKIKIGKIHGSENEIKKISSVIYIRDTRSSETPLAYEGREIDFTYRFAVRGHWRKFDGLGKNRLGERNANGFTWVTEHEKGPTESPLIPKLRRVSIDNGEKFQ